MFTVGLFTTHIPYLFFSFFYLFLFLCPCSSKRIEAKAISSEKRIAFTCLHYSETDSSLLFFQHSFCKKDRKVHIQMVPNPEQLHLCKIDSGFECYKLSLPVRSEKYGKKQVNRPPPHVNELGILMLNA